MAYKKHSLFEVQAIAWLNLYKRYGKEYSVRGEYRLWIEGTGRRSIRVDIAILTKDESEIRAIIAVKRRKNRHPITISDRKRRQEQITNCPLVTIAGMNEAIHAVDTFEKQMKEYGLQL